MSEKRDPIDALDVFPTLDEWADAVRRQAGPLWLVEGLLAADNLVLISGQPKRGMKSWLGLALAMAAASGRPLAGNRVPHPVRTLYVYREGSRPKTLQRLDAIARGNNLPMPGEYGDMLLFRHRGPFFLDDGDWVKATMAFLKLQAERGHPIKLIFLDTLAKSMVGDENSNTEMSRVVAAAEKLRDMGCTVVIVHHTAKKPEGLSAGTWGDPEPDKDLRGASALAGAYESHLAAREYLMDPAGGKKQLFIIGTSKDGESSAFEYGWTFRDKPGTSPAVLETAKLRLDKLPAVPEIPDPEDVDMGEKPARRRKKQPDGN